MEQITQILPNQMMRSLERLEFFDRFTAVEKHRVLDNLSSFMTAHKGEVLIREGGDNNHFFLILKGKVSVSISRSGRQVAEHGEGSFFGEIAFLTQTPHSATVRAEEECILLRLDHRIMETLPAETREKIKDKVVAKLAKRLARMNAKVDEQLDGPAPGNSIYQMQN